MGIDRFDVAGCERTMMAVVTTGNGGYEKLVYREVPVPAPGPGEVLLRVLAAGVNNTEINTRLGWYSSSVTEGTGSTADVPIHTLEGFLFVSGSPTLEDAREFYTCIDLDGYAEKIRCPTLVIHGGLDSITPAENATMLLDKLNTEVETLIWDDSIHCCHDRAHIVRPGMADFMARHL